METTRRGFLKSLGLFTAALVAAPALLLPKKKPVITWQCWEEKGIAIVNARALEQLELGNIRLIQPLRPWPGLGRHYVEDNYYDRIFRT